MPEYFFPFYMESWYQMAYTEGCYNQSPDPTTLPPIWMASCANCLNGECQSLGFEYYQPAFTFTVGCYAWHGGNNGALGAAPVYLGGACDCSSGEASPSPLPSPSPHASPYPHFSPQPSPSAEGCDICGCHSPPAPYEDGKHQEVKREQ